MEDVETIFRIWIKREVRKKKNNTQKKKNPQATNYHIIFIINKF